MAPTIMFDCAVSKVTRGATVIVAASPATLDPKAKRRLFLWATHGGAVTPSVLETDQPRCEVRWDTSLLSPGVHELFCTIVDSGDTGPLSTLVGSLSMEVLSPPVAERLSQEPPRSVGPPTGGAVADRGAPIRVTELPPLSVAMRRSSVPATDDVILWILIRASTDNISFKRYAEFIDPLLCGDGAKPDPQGPKLDGARMVPASHLELPFPGVDAYRLLKIGTEAFLKTRCGVYVDPESILKEVNLAEEQTRAELPPKDLEAMLRDYLEKVPLREGGPPVAPALPYLALIREKVPEIPLVRLAEALSVEGGDLPQATNCVGIIAEKLRKPCFVELIYCYWLEEAHLVQTMNRIAQRFMNIQSEHGDPLANMEIDPLRSLNNVLWGYVQDEQHRLSVRRRAQEYAHQYGLRLEGKAVAALRTADRRSKFVESFHNLLHECITFFRRDDDTTVVADGFPVLNAIKDTHYVLAQSAHNQFQDLPSVARQEILMQQWLLSRPEMREFLGGRLMVPYVEPWMDRVDAMKTLCGWTDVSVAQFADLAVFGEQLLLSIRYGGWSRVTDPKSASTWARYWRAEIQGYTHAYRAVTGVDLTMDAQDAAQLAHRSLPPSVHLLQRLRAQNRE